MRIGDLATHTGLTTKTIRFYEDSGLLPAPPRTPGGYRDYPDHTATRLAFIRDAQRAGLTLAEIRSVLALRDDGHAPCTHVTRLIHGHLDDIDRRMADLVATREALRDLAGRAATTDPAACGADDICTILKPAQP
ncbi:MULTISPECIES: heavy metal-responsive transcriptional regulator [Streptomyces]|uniref:Cd(II)/Pb(II)-responsive transcriptional regulator n=1 Tax=Streptomyces albus (strain ATCC 21838 / DSM 41398 / FERM P-419 / JCM 4703 / NBRC 107858) TaxID=1081613 RepID=A0A0B5EVB0_STRA4|nr:MULTISPECIES: heavy metal-responsive transcriptional regulator [unclassified Streptomyces]AJE82002.1 Cd(II)/Pb(II)-responsive transcriptional regulator [Streptomyces albus]AOU76320.1 Cd(II)/Pb(II)-responsive transcriptional regulator [Streptomyces albus]AYN32105.1 heavy metal-responsive transcriptional regulator [Streptomyces albus]EFF93343.1 Cd(II)/Pb(II)-responsive transcriptional regulator [Streptomyces sp. e14]OKJ72218.1 MerR family transcriptional regulator [Streptomyces sp. CB02460]